MPIPMAVSGCDCASARWQLAHVTIAGCGGAPRAAPASATHTAAASHGCRDFRYSAVIGYPEGVCRSGRFAH